MNVTLTVLLKKVDALLQYIVVSICPSDKSWLIQPSTVLYVFIKVVKWEERRGKRVMVV